MAFSIQGDYVATCSCQLICACAIDGPPTAKDGHCRGAGVFHISEGNLDGTDLSGVNVGWIYHSPGNFTAGNIKMGVVVDESASDDQAKAAEQIFKGEAGGVFAEFVPLVAEWLGLDRAPVTYSGGKNPTATIGKNALEVEVATAPDGSPTEIRNAMMAWRTEGYQIGRGKGKFNAMGVEYDSIYGEHAPFKFAS
jgi:hypothetical protein